MSTQTREEKEFESQKQDLTFKPKLVAKFIPSNGKCIGPSSLNENLPEYKKEQIAK